VEGVAIVAMKTCVVFNPTAKGEKARRFRCHLDDIAKVATLKLTTGPGAAQLLAAEAVREGYDIVVAAGGDGTVNEVLNGLGDAQGFEHSALGVLPLGTVNVFARELGLPLSAAAAWECIRNARESRIDLPTATFTRGGSVQKRYFAQLAGAGLDARAVELVAWKLKKRIGPLAYVVAGMQALLETSARIEVNGDGQKAEGGLVLIGNGRLYGGTFQIFPRADLRDGLIDVCVFPRVNWMTLARCGPQLLFRGNLPASSFKAFQAKSVSMTALDRTPMELDGELVGELPATFTIAPSKLRVIVP
jgi:YegS/Rv2252/BmrU family lipid kinase